MTLTNPKTNLTASDSNLQQPSLDGQASNQASKPADHHPWTNYYQAVAGRPPRETLLTALNAFDADAKEVAESGPAAKFAVDLGCGNGRDTVELLRRNWLVLAIDGEAEAIAQLQQRQDLDSISLEASKEIPLEASLETRVQRFEALILPANVDLINASFCLPFCSPDQFSTMWNKIVTALKPGGRFCGHLFGDRDSWAVYPNRSHHMRSQIDQLLIPFKVELLDEEEHPGKTALGEEKHWHIYNIVAQRLA